MDIRDIKEEVIHPQSALFEMFNLQKVLIDHYVGIEGLPQYPIDINTKSAQVLLKDFIGRIIEELGEAWESYMIMMEIKDNPNITDHRKYMIPHLQNFNEEVSDAIHFWLETMIFVGFEANYMDKWANQFFQQVHIPQIPDLDIWFEIGKNSLDIRHTKYFPAYTVIRAAEFMMKGSSLFGNQFLVGGRRLGVEIMAVMKELLWDITYELQISRNTLKNKPWKQSGMMTDEQQFEIHMMMATRNMFKFFSFAGFTPESLYHIYYKKNKVNQFRIKSKY